MQSWGGGGLILARRDGGQADWGPILVRFWSDWAGSVQACGCSFSGKVGGAKWLIDLMLCYAKMQRQEPECQNVYKCDSFSWLRLDSTILEPENHQISPKLVWQRTQLVGRTSKLVGQPPHQLYRKLRPCVRAGWNPQRRHWIFLWKSRAPPTMFTVHCSVIPQSWQGNHVHLKKNDSSKVKTSNANRTTVGLESGACI